MPVICFWLWIVKKIQKTPTILKNNKSWYEKGRTYNKWTIWSDTIRWHVRRRTSRIKLAKASVSSLIWINFQVMHIPWSDRTSICGLSTHVNFEQRRLICSCSNSKNPSYIFRPIFARVCVSSFFTLFGIHWKVIPFLVSTVFPSVNYYQRITVETPT